MSKLPIHVLRRSLSCARFGVDAKFAAQIADLSIQDLESLCVPGVVLFKPVMPCTQLLRIMRVADPSKRNIVARLLIPVDVTTKAVAAKPLLRSGTDGRASPISAPDPPLADGNTAPAFACLYAR